MVQRTRGPAADTRERLLSGTLACLRQFGVEGTTIAAVSRESGLSRPTIYAHFNTLEELIHRAVEGAAVELSARIADGLTGAASPADAMVEFVVTAHREFKADPVVALVVDMSLDPGLAGHGEISPAMFRLTRGPMRAMLAGETEALEHLDDIIETLVRFLLSVLSYSSDNTRDDDRLRAYLRRSMVPALGLSSTSDLAHA
ncbi:MAG TPA: TetR/AcrR family transcriptional regulator [Aeromicrobium sp.]|nr:TetR/AcrR family transcriptional regulator [Aeromicrobium sp.]HKY57585.1 TetR/AcrR family transcriptional regulator [Aeromicrobium sp.]